MFSLLFWILFGLIVGTVAKWIHPGDEPVGYFHTILIGVGGSFIGGLIHWLIFGGGAYSPAGFVWSIIGGVVFCFLYSRYKAQ